MDVPDAVASTTYLSPGQEQQPEWRASVQQRHQQCEDDLLRNSRGSHSVPGWAPVLLL